MVLGLADYHTVQWSPHMSFQEAEGPAWEVGSTINLLRVTRGNAFPYLCQCAQSETPTDTPVIQFLTRCSEGEHTS